MPLGLGAEACARLAVLSSMPGDPSVGGRPRPRRPNFFNLLGSTATDCPPFLIVGRCVDQGLHHGLGCRLELRIANSVIARPSFWIAL